MESPWPLGLAPWPGPGSTHLGGPEVQTREGAVEHAGTKP